MPTDTIGELTPVQEKVLALLSAGSTVSAAAEAAGVHRNTIANWRYSSSAFRCALLQAESEKARYWQDQIGALAVQAMDAVRGIVTDPNAPAAVRLKAALSILRNVALISLP